MTELTSAELFAEAVIEWLQHHKRLLDVLLILRIENEHEAVAALLATREVAGLRLAWELHHQTCGPAAVTAAIVRRGLPPVVESRHHQALWGSTRENEPFGCLPVRDSR